VWHAVITGLALQSLDHPNSAFSSNPPSRIAARQVQKSACLASACMAALANWLPTLRLARANSGIAISEAHASTIPATLRSGALRCMRSRTDSNVM